MRQRARELGLSDAEVARRVGLSQSRYANYVVDKREPDLLTLVRICRVLKTTPDVLLEFGAFPGVASENDRLREAIGAAMLSMGTKPLRTLAEVAAALAGRDPPHPEE